VDEKAVTQGAPETQCAARVQTRGYVRGGNSVRYAVYVFLLRNRGRTSECEIRRRTKKVIILGGGPNRIGQGIEFDYCCVHACYALKEAGYETIMINCNPETVSTDYDTSDRLYFEPLTAEDVIEIIRAEEENGTIHGVIVQLGGQTPLKLCMTSRRRGFLFWDGPRRD
jgi:hypothetical protein